MGRTNVYIDLIDVMCWLEVIKSKQRYLYDFCSINSDTLIKYSADKELVAQGPLI